MFLDPRQSQPPEMHDNDPLGTHQPASECKHEEETYEDYFEEDQDDDNSYGASGEKYGWYNGWSDDAIDDAFDGDPEATWNVD